MRFRVLGPLEVTRGGNSVHVGGVKPRTVLTILLVNAGAVVPVDRLVEALWGNGPPTAAVTSLRSYVSRLRTAVWAADGDHRLQYRAPGYILALDDGELDAVEFVRLTTEARAHAALHDHARALQRFDAALQLWRGDPFAEFVEVAELREEATRLHEIQAAATEDRAACLHLLGRCPETIPELTRLVADHPLRERPAVLLMQALADSGRRADALAVYAALRGRLVDELGVEPSAPARQAHQWLLADEPVAALAEVISPTNVPRVVTSLVGRTAETARVVARLHDTPLLTLTGVGGVGKTRLAIEVAHACRSHFPDGVWFCELAPLPDAEPVGTAVAAALRVQARAGTTVEQRLVEYLAPRQLLLVIDNCEHVINQAAALISTIVHACPSVVVLATSREALRVEGEQIWPVPPLPVPAASELFVHRARALQPTFRPGAADHDPLRELCRRLDGLPLAIELAAAQVRSMSTAEMVTRLDAFPAAPIRTASPRHRSLDAALGWSYRLLTPAEQQLFVRMSVFVGTADAEAVHAVCADPETMEGHTVELLTELVNKSMVDSTVRGSRTRFRLLETMRVFGRDRLRSAGRSDELSRRHATYYADLAVRAAAELQGPDEQRWVERTLPEHENFRTAFEWAAQHRDTGIALPLVVALTEVSQLRIGAEAGTWAETALEFTPIDSPHFVACVGAAARGAWTRGDLPRAAGLAALAGPTSAGAGTGRPGHPSDVLADIQIHNGDLDAALHHHQFELCNARTAGDPLRLSFRLHYLAVCHAARREPNLGLPLAEESVQLAITTGNPSARAMAGYSLGLVVKKTEPDRALREFDLAAELASSVHNFWWYGVAGMEAAATRSVHYPPTASIPAFLHVLDHWDRVGDQTQQWLNLHYITRLLTILGAHDDAAALHDQLVTAGQRSPLSSSSATSALSTRQPIYGSSRNPRPDTAVAVALARATLLRRCGASGAADGPP